MRTEKICENVWKFKGRTCTYLIKGDVNVLIDAGDACECEELREAIEKVLDLNTAPGSTHSNAAAPSENLRRLSIDYVLLTHLHYDHVGCLGLFPNARIFASEVEIKDYSEDAKGYFFHAGDEVDSMLKEKLEALPDEIAGLEVLRVPGHTRGCVAFLDRERKLLFSGDTVFAGEVVGRTDLPNSLPGEMGGSVERLRKLEREGFRVLAGHGY